jgi:hypothetical protein
MKATAFRRYIGFIQIDVTLLTQNAVDEPRPLLRGHYPASSLLRRGPPLNGASVFRPRASSA